MAENGGEGRITRPGRRRRRRRINQGVAAPLWLLACALSICPSESRTHAQEPAGVLCGGVAMATHDEVKFAGGGAWQRDAVAAAASSRLFTWPERAAAGATLAETSHRTGDKRRA